MIRHAHLTGRFECSWMSGNPYYLLTPVLLAVVGWRLRIGRQWTYVLGKNTRGALHSELSVHVRLRTLY